MHRMVPSNNIIVNSLILRVVILIDLFQKLFEIALLIQTRGVALMIIPLLKSRISNPVICIDEGVPYSNMDLNLKCTNRLSNNIRKHHEIVVNILVRFVLVSLVISLFDLQKFYIIDRHIFSLFMFEFLKPFRYRLRLYIILGLLCEVNALGASST